MQYEPLHNRSIFPSINHTVALGQGTFCMCMPLLQVHDIFTSVVPPDWTSSSAL